MACCGTHLILCLYALTFSMTHNQVPLLSLLQVSVVMASAPEYTVFNSWSHLFDQSRYVALIHLFIPSRIIYLARTIFPIIGDYVNT